MLRDNLSRKEHFAKCRKCTVNVRPGVRHWINCAAKGMDGSGNDRTRHAPPHVTHAAFTQGITSEGEPSPLTRAGCPYRF